MTTQIPSKETILAMLDTWIRQRPGLEYGNYGDPVAYRAELRSIGKDLAHARQLLRAVELSGITAEDLMRAFPSAFSGRLTLKPHPKKPGAWVLDYCTGQYWPTEYRCAACAVLASALWDYKREKCMPAPLTTEGPEHSRTTYLFSGNAVSAGDYLRSTFRREFGRGIANRWFN